jgi:hypothetical protein
MASDHRSRFALTIQGIQEPPAPYLDQVRHRPIAVDLPIPVGSGNAEFDVLYAAEGSILSGANVLIDLKTALDRYGVALNLADVALVYIQSADTSTGLLVVSAGPTNGWTNYIGTVGNLLMKAGDAEVSARFSAGNTPVTPTNKVLELAASGGDVDYVLSIWGRR